MLDVLRFWIIFRRVELYVHFAISNINNKQKQRENAPNK